MARCIRYACDWLEKYVSATSFNGKTICWSANSSHKAYHVVSAFIAENQITLGEITVEEKSNKITAVLKDTEEYFNAYADEMPKREITEKEHGRIEKREYRLLTDIGWLENIIRNKKINAEINHF